MQKKAVKVLIRTRPTDQFATKNLKVNTDNGVSISTTGSDKSCCRTSKCSSTKKIKES